MKVKIRQYQESDRTAFVKHMEQLMDYIVSIDDLKRTRRMPEFGESYTQRAPERVKKLEGQVQALHVDFEELNGTLKKLLSIEGSSESGPEQRKLLDYVF